MVLSQHAQVADTMYYCLDSEPMWLFDPYTQCYYSIDTYHLCYFPFSGNLRAFQELYMATLISCGIAPSTLMLRLPDPNKSRQCWSMRSDYLRARHKADTGP